MTRSITTSSESDDASLRRSNLSLIDLIYDGTPVKMTPEQEELASFYAAKLETPYVENDVFNRNFFDAFKSAMHKVSLS